MNADGTNVRRITANPAQDAQPAWSPNGQRIAFASDRHGNYEIYQVAANGIGPVFRMTQHPAADLSPDWSPEGARIGFMTLRDGNREIYSIDSNGSAVTLMRLTNHPRDDIQPAWGPNGKILFSAIRTNNWHFSRRPSCVLVIGYICRLINFNRLTCPSSCPLLHSGSEVRLTEARVLNASTSIGC